MSSFPVRVHPQFCPMAPLILFAVPAGLVWWILMVRRSGLMLPGLLTLCAGVCFGPPFFQMGLISLERLLVVALGVTYLIMRHFRLTDEKPVTKGDVCVGLFLLTLVLSTFTHDWHWEKNLPVARLLFYYMLPACMYIVARQMCVEPRHLRFALYAAAGFGLYLSVTSIAEKTDQLWAVFPRYIASPLHEEFLGRGRGPLLNPSGNGILICLGLFSLWMLWTHVGRWGKLLIPLLTVIYAGGVFCTLTRCVWLGALLGATLVAWLAFPPKVRRVMVIGCVLATVVGGPVAFVKFRSFKRDKNVSVADMQQSAALRPILAYVAWEMFRDYPLTGVGLGQYKNVDKYYLNQRDTDFTLEQVRPYHQHNVVLSILTETGLIGTVFYLAMFAAWSTAAYRLWQHSEAPLVVRQMGLVFLTLCAAYFANGMFQDVTIVPMVHMTLFYFAGLVVGLYWTHVHATVEPSRRFRWSLPWQRRAVYSHKTTTVW